MRRIAVFVLALSIAAGATASPVYRVKEINTIPTSVGSYPEDLVALGSNVVVFTTNDYQGYPAEVWRSDGTDAGTFSLGAGGASIAVWNSKVWFISGTGLKYSDGTVAGTKSVPLPAGIVPTVVMAGPNALYFGTTAEYLYRTDGTAAGTVRVSSSKLRVVAPGSRDGESFCGIAGQSLIFMVLTVQDAYPWPTVTTALWQTNGTTTTKIVDFGVGGGAMEFVSLGASVLFVARDPQTYYSRLWRTDGTTAGTYALTTTTYNMLRPVVQGTKAWFAHEGRLWRTDGTTAGTMAVSSATSGTAGYFNAFPIAATTNGIVIGWGAPVNPPDFSQTYSGIYAFNGTTTTFIANVTQHNRPGGAAVGNLVIFGGRNQVFRTDGTVAGTFKVTDASGDDGVRVWPMTAVGTRVFFSAAHPVYGWELFKSDGTVANSGMVKDIRPGTFGSEPDHLTPLNGGVLFTAADDADNASYGTRNLWFSNGTEAGTQVIASRGSWLSESFTPCGPRAYFVRQTEETGGELWSTDGTAGGTQLVHDIHPGSGNSNAYPMLCAENTLMFFADDGTGRALWRSDGTSAGTVPVRTIVASDSVNYPGMARMGRGVFMSFGRELWASNGTTLGTRRIRTFDYEIYSLMTAGPYGYIATGSAHGDWILWRTDGTDAGTIQLTQPGWVGLLADADGKLAFRFSPRTDGDTMIDGYYFTTGGTPVWFDPGPTSSSSWVFRILTMNGRIYYNIPELWRSNGSIRERVGEEQAQTLLAVGGGRLYFSTTGTNWPLLKETSGTAAGTKLLEPFVPDLRAAVVSGGRLFIAGDELYAYDLDVAAVSMAPGSVSTAGGQQVVISGRGFVAPVSVTVGGYPASVASVTATAITFVTPAKPAGTHDVRFTNGDGRQIQTDVPLTYLCAAPTAQVSAQPATVCPLTPVVLQGSGGTRCVWFPATGLDNPESCTPTARVSTNTRYTLITYNASGCPSTNNPTVTVSVHPLPDTQIAITPVNAGGWSTPGASFIASVPDAGAGATYAWTIDGGQLLTSTTQRSVTFRSDCGYPLLRVTVTGANGCPAKGELRAGVISNVSLTSVSRNVVHPGTQVTLNGGSLDCVSKLTLYPSWVETPVPFTTVNSGEIRFRVPAHARPEFHIQATTSTGATLYWTAKQFSRVSRDDISGDGQSDVIVRNPSTGAADLWRMPRTWENTVHLRPAGSTDYRVLATVDHGYIGNAEILWLRESTRELVLQEVSFYGDHVERVIGVLPADLTIAAAGDLDGDGVCELILRNTTTGATVRWELAGYTHTDYPVHPGRNLSWNIAAARDFDGDGRADLLWRDTNTGAMLIWFMDGSTITSGKSVHPGGNLEWVIAGVADFDGDTKSDVLLRRTTTGATLLWQMDGATIVRATTVHGGSNLGWVVAGTGDYDGDGKADILWRESSSGQTLWWQMSGARIVKANVVQDTTATAAWNIETPKN